MISSNEFENIYEKLKEYISPTPLRESKWLSKILGGKVYLKLECLNPGRSFKIRGAMSTLLQQSRTPDLVVTASGGNHGLGVAIACNWMNIPCKVVLPKSTSSYRIQLLEEFGAEVELFGDAWDEANEYAKTQAKSVNILYIHPFADKEVIMGQGTITYEIADQMDITIIDNMVASVGGGGLIAGNAMAMRLLNPNAQIIAVETKGADSLATSLSNEELTSLDAITSIAKTLGAKSTTPELFDILNKNVDHMVVVEDKEAVDMLFQILDHEKILVEPATSCSIAAAFKNKALFQNKTTIIIVCGSNVSYNEVLQWQEEFLK